MSDFLTLVDHPIVQTKLAELRAKKTTPHSFRHILGELSLLMAYEATRGIPTEMVEVETPLKKAKIAKVTSPVTIISILRAGLPMIDGVLNIIPMAKVGHIGIYRDKFINNTVEYYFKIPEITPQSHVLLCDPVIATGHTMIAACNRLKEYNIKNVTILSLLISKEGLERLQESHPNVKVFTASVEEEMTDKGYLIPGVGDIGDRIYGTL